METKEKHEAGTETHVNGDGTGHSTKALEDIDNEEELLQMTSHLAKPISYITVFSILPCQLKDTTDYRQRKEIRLAIRALKRQSEGETEEAEKSRARRPSGGRRASSDRTHSSGTVTGLAARKGSTSGGRQSVRRNSGHLVACRSAEAQGRKTPGGSSSSHKVLERQKSQEKPSPRKNSQDVGESSRLPASPTQKSRRKSSSSSETSRLGRHPSIEDIEDEAVLLRMVKETSDVEEKRRLRARIRAVRRLSRDRKDLAAVNAQGEKSTTQSDSPQAEEVLENPVETEAMDCAQEIPEVQTNGLTNGDSDASSTKVDEVQESGEEDLSSKTEEDLQYMLLVCADYDERKKIRQALRTARKNGQPTGSTVKQATTAGSVKDSRKPATSLGKPKTGKEVGKLPEAARKLENGTTSKKSTSYRKDMKNISEGKVASLGNKWEAFVDKSNPFGRRNSNSKESDKEKGTVPTLDKAEKASSKETSASASKSVQNVKSDKSTEKGNDLKLEISIADKEKSSDEKAGKKRAVKKNAGNVKPVKESKLSVKLKSDNPVDEENSQESNAVEEKPQDDQASIEKKKEAVKKNAGNVTPVKESTLSVKLKPSAEKTAEKESSQQPEKDTSHGEKMSFKEKKQRVKANVASLTTKESSLSVSLAKSKKGKSWEGLLKDKPKRHRVFRLDGQEDKDSAQEEEDTETPSISEEETAPVEDEAPPVDDEKNDSDEEPASAGNKWDKLFFGKSSGVRKIKIDEDTLNSLPRARVKSGDSEAGKDDVTETAGDQDASDDTEEEKDVKDDADEDEDVIADADEEVDKDTESAGEDADSEQNFETKEYTEELSDTETDLDLLVDTDAENASDADDNISTTTADADANAQEDNKSPPCVYTTQSHTLEAGTTISGVNRDKKTNQAGDRIIQDAEAEEETSEQDMESVMILDEDELAGIEEEVGEDQIMESENKDDEEIEEDDPQEDLKDDVSPQETSEESQDGLVNSSAADEDRNEGTTSEDGKAEMTPEDSNTSEATVDAEDSTSTEQVAVAEEGLLL
ncbi:Hypp529 [Branchiostoma lanceolatum]|uniref:Hypp529 protein n=1 Tax=Branchiostoma lanceolatum TaxID=7740 RepID=A0A8J9VEU0_BRALA|nr:Hypp529 [Branchiostoma lanceolatum]